MRAVLVVGLGLVLTGCSASAPGPSAPATVTVTAPPTPAAAPPATPTTPAGWAQVASDVGSGVLFVDVVSCDGTGSHGSGSLVAEDLVLTAAHVVDTAQTVAVRSGTGPIPADVVALDPDHDLAVLRTATRVAGHVFALAEQAPAAGTDVAALGFPLGEQLSITEGIVSALNTTTTDDDAVEVRELLITSAVNLGNSGGPLVDRDGLQVGVVSAIELDVASDERAEGRSFAVASEQAAALLDTVESQAATPAAGCDGYGEEGESEPWGGDWEHPLWVIWSPYDELANSLVPVVADHGHAIDRRAWDEAFARFTPAMQERMGGVEMWSAGLATTTWDEIEVISATGDESRASLSARVRTRQDPTAAAGLACTDLALVYHLVPGGSSWLIESVEQAAEPAACP